MKRLLAVLCVFAMLGMVMATGVFASEDAASGETILIEETGPVDDSVFPIAEGTVFESPEGTRLTFVDADGVEFDPEAGEEYSGVTAVVTDALELHGHDSSSADWEGSEYRAAFYLDETGLVESASVLEAGGDYTYEDGVLSGVEVVSEGTTFNGIIVNEGTHVIRDGAITLNGDGGNDFNGYGAAILITGEDTEVIIDNMTVDATGLTRGAMCTANSAKVLVMNSTYMSHEGVLPDDYIPNVENSTGIMKASPWASGFAGNNRATNLLGSATSTYFNSFVSADGWGVLSGDDAVAPTSNIVNTTVYSDGERVYGMFGIGSDNHIRILGSDVEVSGFCVYASLGCQLLVGPATEENMADVYGADTIMADANYDPEANSTLKSENHAIFVYGSVDAEFQPGTVIESGTTTIICNYPDAVLNFDGCEITSDSGVILQVMDSDNANADMSDPTAPLNTSYTEDDADPVAVEGRDLLTADVEVNFSDMEIEGDFYNSTESYTTEEKAGVSTSAYNLSVNLVSTSLDGVISASLAQHVDPDTGEILKTITTYDQVMNVVNTARPVINNGVNVTLTDGSAWTVAGDSYLSSLSVDDSSEVIVPAGVTLTVAGEEYTDTVLSGISISVEATASGEAAEEASGEASDEASGEAAESLDEAYVEYIHEFLLAELETNDTMTEEQIDDEFLPLVEAGDYETFPADMLYSGMLNSGAAMTYDEFAAAGGVY